MDLVIPVLLVIKDEMQLNNKRKDTNKYKGNKRKKKVCPSDCNVHKYYPVKV